MPPPALPVLFVMIELETVRIAPVALKMPPAPPPLAMLEDLFEDTVESEM